MLLFTLSSFFLLRASALDYDEELFRELRVRTGSEVQAKAAKGVVTRLLGSDRAELFALSVDDGISEDGRDTFRILKDQSDERVTIVGSSGVSATWGFHYYLKRYCNCHVSWDGDQLHLPKVLPSANVTKSSIDKFKYYQNVCTSSYSFVWWNWTRWEREIDWMALNGINLALAFTAQEAIWQRVYDGLGLAANDFTGPAFLAWNRMGNLRNFGRGLNSNWHSDSVKLQHLILARMRDLGMIPVLPAFSGIVPKSYKVKFPLAQVTNLTRWNNFTDDFCCPYLLSPSDPMFPVISRIFLREYILEFGTNHVYNCDTFNENVPSSNDPKYLSKAAKSIYNGIMEMDPLGVWMLQGWMFIHPFWGREQVKAYVTSVPIGRMLILDLQSDLTPQYEYFDSYFGQPFIWCMLHNFGGQLGMYGYLNLVNEGVVRGRSFDNSTMVGIGIAPEGIDQNYIMYDFALDSALRSGVINLTKWVSSYAVRRYGAYDENVNQAWSILKDTVYDYNFNSMSFGGRAVAARSSYGAHISKNILTKRPSLTMSEMIWYNRSEVLEAFRMLLLASRDSDVSSSQLFAHDLIDVSRQTIQLSIGALYTRLMSDYVTNDVDGFRATSSQFLDLLADLDAILSTGKKFLLGKWLEDAKEAGKTTNETVQYEYNARNQITLWGPRGEIRDYAAKQWSGLVADYYKPRWGIFVDELARSLADNAKYNGSRARARMMNEVEQPFTLSTKRYPTDASGRSALEAVAEFARKWYDALSDLFRSDAPVAVKTSVRA